MNGVHVDVFLDHKSLQYVFKLRKLNLRQWRWFELLKDYDVSVHYHLGKANVVVDALRRLSIRSTNHVDDGKKELVKDVRKLARLGVLWIASSSRGFSVYPSFEAYLVPEVKKGHHLDSMLMELKDSVLLKVNESFALGGDGILRYKTSYLYQMG